MNKNSKVVTFIFILCIAFITCREKKDVIEFIIPIEEILSIEKESDPNYSLYFPQDLDVDREGNIYLVDTFNSRIQIFDKRGKYLKTIGRNGKGPLEFDKPEDIFIDKRKDRIYIADTRNLRIQVSSLKGKFITQYKLMFAPQQIVAIEPFMYVSRFPSNRVFGKGEKERYLIKKLDNKGKIIREFLMPVDTGYIIPNLLVNMLSITADRKENLICAHTFGVNRILKFDKEGNILFKFKTLYKASEWAKPNFFFNIDSEEDMDKFAYIVADIACDINNNIYVLSGNLKKNEDGVFEKGREIYKFNPSGKYSGTIILPVSGKIISFDEENGLYVIDEKFIIRKYNIIIKI